MWTIRDLRNLSKKTDLVLAGLVALLIAGLIVFLGQDPLNRPQDYKSAEYSFNYPSGWVVQDPKTSPVAKVFKVWIKKEGTNSSFGIREKIISYKGDLATLKTELAESLGTLEGFREVLSSEITAAGSKALKYEYTKQEKADDGQSYTAHQ